MKLLLCLFASATLFAAEQDPLAPLLLPVKTLKRLKLDRERQTDRWLAFEQRVQTTTDSPERGLELAVYSAVTGDAEKGHASIAWTLGHPCNALDKALVSVATADVQSTAEAAKLSALACPDNGRPLARFGLGDMTQSRNDFLLALRPEEVEHPTWQQHVAALMLVTLDPNSQAAQFLQGWATEDRFILRDGPGVVYELLYANPYLPGVSYQNMNPWRYEAGSLRARSEWNAQACWIHISPTKREQANCPADVWTHSMRWGNLLLLPVDRRCVDIPSEPGITTVLSNLPVRRKLQYTGPNGEKDGYESDDAGLWQIPPGTPGKICVAR